ncbi:hypothetical protein BDV12DRAFT_84056 [Aspergillus spectabilis]
MQGSTRAIGKDVVEEYRLKRMLENKKSFSLSSFLLFQKARPFLFLKQNRGGGYGEQQPYKTVGRFFFFFLNSAPVQASQFFLPFGMTNTEPNHQNLADGLMHATVDMARRQQVTPLHDSPLKERQSMENLRIILRLQAGTGRRTPTTNMVLKKRQSLGRKGH